MGYGTLEHAFWEDPDLRELSLDGRCFAAYLLTCRHSSSEGYYRCPIGYVCDDLGIDRDAARHHFTSLDLMNFARFDPASEVVFIRNAMRYRPPRGRPSITGALRRAVEVAPNPFRGLFYDAAVQYAPEFATVLRDAGWTSDTIMRTPSLFESTPLPEPEPLPLPEPPRALGPGPSTDIDIDAVLRQAAHISVQQSLVKREPIRNADAVATSRLARNGPLWRPLVETWITLFPSVTAHEMACALVDGGTAKPHWQRTR